jgi:hypothetical protein
MAELNGDRQSHRLNGGARGLEMAGQPGIHLRASPLRSLNAASLSPTSSTILLCCYRHTRAGSGSHRLPGYPRLSSFRGRSHTRCNKSSFLDPKVLALHVIF